MGADQILKTAMVYGNGVDSVVDVQASTHPDLAKGDEVAMSKHMAMSKHTSQSIEGPTL